MAKFRTIHFMNDKRNHPDEETGEIIADTEAQVNLDEAQPDDAVSDPMPEQPLAEDHSDAVSETISETIDEAAEEEPEEPPADISDEQHDVPRDDDFDVSAALAAVAMLDQLASEDEPETRSDETSEMEILTSDDADGDVEWSEETALAGYSEAAGDDEDSEDAVVPIYTMQPAAVEQTQSDYPHPGLFTMRRGQAASVVPALALIALGSFLTFWLTTTESGTALDPLIVGGAVVGVVAIGLLSHWWSSRRWARGSFFGATILAGVSITTILLIQPGALGLVAGWPLLIGAVGLAFALTGLLTQPRSGSLVSFGVLLAVVSGVALSVTAQLLPPDILETAAELWPVALVLAIVFVLVPVTRRG